MSDSKVKKCLRVYANDYNFDIDETVYNMFEYVDDDEVTYTWGVGPSGDLMIFRSLYHKQFSAALEKDSRYHCYSAGSWFFVENANLDDKEFHKQDKPQAVVLPFDRKSKEAKEDEREEGEVNT